MQLTGDLVGLLDAIGADDAVFVGHDWGAMVVWNLALLHPERVRAVAGLSVPFTPRGERDPIAAMEWIFAGRFFYILYFQEPGVADAELAADVEGTFRRLLRTSTGELRDATVQPARIARRASSPPCRCRSHRPDWLSEEDLASYVDEFTRTGFTGGLNWYRNIRRNWERTAQLDGARILVPAMFLTGDRDPVTLFMSDAHLDECIPDLRAKLTLEGAGHWVQQERPDEVSTALLSFLAGLE